MPRPSRLVRHLLAPALALALGWLAPVQSAAATWSIVITDSETKEVAVGTVTCLNDFDLLAIVPVVIVGEGAAACQAAGDFNGTRRPIIAFGLRLDRTPEQILASLAGISGHQSRQYGLVDTDGAAVTFTGGSTLAWAGGIVGGQGTLTWAIQGNILVGPCVVSSIEAAMLATEGDMAEKLMAGMEAARDAGGDGRCSCNGDPTSCGCPVQDFAKSGHIGGMVVARVGDTDDPSCNAAGCVDGDYFMRLNVAFQGTPAPDPVDQLRTQFDAWRAERAERVDALATEIQLPAVVPANAASTVTMRVIPRTASGRPPATPVRNLLVEHAESSAGLATIGTPAPQADGSWLVTLSAGAAAGTDLFRVVLDDGAATYEPMPRPRLVHAEPGDVDGDGLVDTEDLLRLLATWGPCPGGVQGCPADADGDGQVGLGDLLVLLGRFD